MDFFGWPFPNSRRKENGERGLRILKPTVPSANAGGQHPRQSDQQGGQVNEGSIAQGLPQCELGLPGQNKIARKRAAAQNTAEERAAADGGESAGPSLLLMQQSRVHWFRERGRDGGHQVPEP